MSWFDFLRGTGGAYAKLTHHPDEAMATVGDLGAATVAMLPDMQTLRGALADPMYYRSVGQGLRDVVGRAGADVAAVPVELAGMVTSLPENTSGNINFGREDLIRRMINAGYIGDTPNLSADVLMGGLMLNPAKVARTVPKVGKELLGMQDGGQIPPLHSYLRWLRDQSAA